jgi:hypothetical protein
VGAFIYITTNLDGQFTRLPFKLPRFPRQKVPTWNQVTISSLSPFQSHKPTPPAKMLEPPKKKEPTASEAMFFFAIVKHTRNKADIDWAAVAQDQGFKNADVAKVRMNTWTLHLTRANGVGAFRPSQAQVGHYYQRFPGCSSHARQEARFGYSHGGIEAVGTGQEEGCQGGGG